MTATQHLASALRPTHPSHAEATAPKGPRNMKETLSSAFISHLEPHLTDNVLPPGAYPETLKAVHTSFVQSSIAKIGANPILNEIPPAVDKSEAELPRKTRTTLSQLRSGHSLSLESFKMRIGLAQTSACPECGADAHTTNHLFSCPNFPTTLTPRDLWLQPKRVARFLSQMPSFSSLPPSVPPRPRPPPASTWR